MWGPAVSEAFLVPVTIRGCCLLAAGVGCVCVLLLTMLVLKLCRERLTCCRWCSPHTCSNGKLEKLFGFLIVFSCWSACVFLSPVRYFNCYLPWSFSLCWVVVSLFLLHRGGVAGCWDGTEGSQSHTTINQPYGKWQHSVRCCRSAIWGNLELMGRGMFYMFIYFIAANNAVGLFCCSGSWVTLYSLFFSSKRGQPLINLWAMWQTC